MTKKSKHRQTDAVANDTGKTVPAEAKSSDKKQPKDKSYKLPKTPLLKDSAKVDGDDAKANKDGSSSDEYDKADLKKPRKPGYRLQHDASARASAKRNDDISERTRHGKKHNEHRHDAAPKTNHSRSTSLNDRLGEPHSAVVTKAASVLTRQKSMVDRHRGGRRSASVFKMPGQRCFKLVMALFVLLAVVAGAVVGLYFWRAQYDNKAEQVQQATETKKKEVTVIDYNKTIGFIGDSLTYGMLSESNPAPEDEVRLLGDGYKAINRGVNGATTQNWLDDLLEPATAEFKKQQVEVVQIMLGTNDAEHEVSLDKFLDNYREIIGRLEKAGIKKIIINKIPYTAQRNIIRLRDYNDNLDQLVDGELVFIGDDTAFDYFRDNQNYFADGLHFTVEGYQKLAELWAAGFKRVLVESNQLKLNIPVDNYQLKSNQKLAVSIKRDVKRLADNKAYGGIFVDDKKLSEYDYRISGDSKSTQVQLQPAYLDKLAAGEHVVELRFIDGVHFGGKFTVKAAE